MSLRPFFEDVQAHYDLSDDFYKLFLDSRMMYSCAYFERDDMSLEEAQVAKIDLSLGKCGLKPGMRLLDVGCGWGATALRAAEKYGVRVVGLTLSQNQHAHASALAEGREDVEFRLQGWEQFREPVDAIVSIGAFEHFRIERYADFFARCHQILPAEGKLLLHTIVHGNEVTVEPGRELIDADVIRFMKFIHKEIFPGGQVPPREVALEHAIAGGFRVTRIQSLRPHYARTLDCWALALERAKEQALAIAPLTVYERYQRYLTSCANYFRTGHCDVLQFSLEKAPA